MWSNRHHDCGPETAVKTPVTTMAKLSRQPPRLNRIQRNEQTAQIAEQSAPELLQKVM
jgi:hypothetical protein